MTLQGWTSGSEVKFSYGPLPNSRLLLLHGFCLPDNAFEAVELWAMMEPGAPNYAEKSEVGVSYRVVSILQNAGGAFLCCLLQSSP